MKNLMETIRAMGVNTPRPGTDDTTVPTVKGDMPTGEITPNPADKYQAVKNRMAQVKTKIIDDEYKPGEANMPQEKVSASFLEALKQVQTNAAELSEKKKKAKPDFLDLDKDGNEKESMKKAAKEAECAEGFDVDAGGNRIAYSDGLDAGGNRIAAPSDTDDAPKSKPKTKTKSKVKEEVEQVDEILDTTAKGNSYKSKANASLFAAIKSGDKATVKKRDKGLDMAYDKTINAMKKSRLAKEEVEQVDEVRSWFIQSDHDDFKKMTPDEKKEKHQRLLKLTNHSDSHIRSFAKSAANEFKQKYMSEEVEQVDEISTELATKVMKQRKSQGDAFRNKAGIMSGSASDSAMANAKKNWNKADKIASIVKKRAANEEVELEEAATMVLRKGGQVKRMRYNPRTIEKMKAEGWVVATEAFVEKVKTLFNISEDLSVEDAVALVEEEQAKRGRGRPKKAVDPNAAPKPTWKPGGRGRPPKNKDDASKISTSDTKAAAPTAKEPEKADAGDTEHVLVQLRKAANNERGEHDSGTNTIKYTNNTTGQITSAQARKALTAHDNLKTAGDRFKAQRRMGGSHAGMLAHISGKADTSAAKPKVSLAKPDWNKK